MNLRKAEQFLGTRRQMLVAERFIRYRGPQQIWLFKCDCGGSIERQKGNFVNCSTNNCGCRHGLMKYAVPTRNEDGKPRQIYIAWVNMRQRCDNEDKWDYKYYGGRGIKYCEEWKDFAQFEKDMGKAFEVHRSQNSTTTLDRIDTDGDYSAANCRWATRLVQSRNRRFCRIK